MKKEEFDKRIAEVHVTWNCRFHPFGWWHEVGCPHKEWTVKDLTDALISKKKFEQSGLKGTVLS